MQSNWVWVAGAGAILLIAVLFRLMKRGPQSIDDLDSSEALALREEVLKLVPHPVLLLSGQYSVIYLNPAAEKLFDSPLRRVLGRFSGELFELISPKSKVSIKDFLDLSRSENAASQTRLVNCIVKYQNSIEAWMNVTIKAIELSDDPLKAQYVLFLEDITATRVVESQLSYMERHDSQTGLLNRKAFESVLKASIDDAKKHGSFHVLMSLSIDQFKTINDTVGYAAGDALIKQVVSVLKSTAGVEGENIAGRLAGNDFGVLFKETSLSVAAEAMKLIRNDIHDLPFSWNTRAFPVTLSGGFVVIKNNVNSAARALTEADIACRTARNHGGNRVLAYRIENIEMRQEQSNMDGIWNLKKAFRDNRFRLFAQPIHPLAEGEYNKSFNHYELLIRMLSEEGEYISPGEFLPVAEYYSMMPDLDRWVVREAFSYIAKVLPSDVPPMFSINLSGQSLDEASFRDYVLDELSESGVDAQMVCFEITEAVAVNDLSLAKRFISSLRAKGSSFSLDDFGTGVSSYGYLQSLDVDYLKIDGVFVKDLLRDTIARNIVESVTHVGHSMGLKIIAEYAENEKIISVLSKMGVDYGQGYGISKPSPLEDVIRPHIAHDKIAETA